jgi:AcrR family transcriptional regulator
MNTDRRTGPKAGSAKGRGRRGELADTVAREAFALVEEEGPEQLSLRRIQERMGEISGRRFSATAPLHHFGTVTGLYATVARQGFAAVAGKLREEREKSQPNVLAARLAVTYGTFGLERQSLYRAMHWPAVWARYAELEGSPGPFDGAALTEAGRLWEAGEERDQAFAELVIAVQLGQAAGSLKGQWPPRDVARVLTSLVDGYLFQTMAERVDAPTKILREDLELYINMVMNGLAQPESST